VSTHDSLGDELTIRAQVPEDRPVVATLIASAFGDRDVADLDRALDGQARGVAYVASLGEHIVGHVRVTWGWLDTREQLVDILVLSPCSVAPARQRQGVGRALVAQAVAAAEELGAPVLVLEGDPSFYSRCGFVAAAEVNIYPPSTRIPDRAFQAVGLPGLQPWMSGRVVYPDVFWQYDAVGLRGERLDRELRRLGTPPIEPSLLVGAVSDIRRATVEDAEGIARVHVATWQDAYVDILPADFLAGLRWQDRADTWRVRLADPDSRSGTWIVTSGGQVVGFASGGPARDDDRSSPQAWELYGIYLASQAWRQGLGTALAAQVLAELPDEVVDVSLWVLADNARARRFYERLGFVPDGVTRTETIGGRDVDEFRYLRAR
jgi:putative acetyltransferase